MCTLNLDDLRLKVEQIRALSNLLRFSDASNIMDDTVNHIGDIIHGLSDDISREVSK